MPPPSSRGKSPNPPDPSHSSSSAPRRLTLGHASPLQPPLLPRPTSLGWPPHGRPPSPDLRRLPHGRPPSPDLRRLPHGRPPSPDPPPHPADLSGSSLLLPPIPAPPAVPWSMPAVAGHRTPPPSTSHGAPPSSSPV
ncbi:hypothetical protein BRADI_4g06913v3 [Brachypodium distachyon]|uniref:Uncharacterized protein n=1 Tax=Brachypodium distachyon TaxID=15368 RepID=A0A2K2CKW5_BRADI|nr:hypothetical protein BRADI_4g06913v3 [Brachypodium distachyon]